MPTAVGHALTALPVAAAFPETALPRRAWILGAVCAAAPDADVLGTRLLRIPYDHLFGHRGFSHGVVLAALLALFMSVFLAGWAGGATTRRTLYAFFFICALSHGMLDAFTSGGMGIAFLAPFSGERYFMIWQPVAASPLGIRRMLSREGLRALANEFFWLGLPSLAIFSTLMLLRRARRIRSVR